MKIIKRDGAIEDFDKSKIINAISKAFESADKKLLEDNPAYIPNKEYEIEKSNAIADYIYEKAESLMEKENKSLSVEEIQDMVEAGLQNTKRKDVAKAYIIYRNDRTRIRNKLYNKFSFEENVRYKFIDEKGSSIYINGIVKGIIYDSDKKEYFYILKDIVPLFKESDLMKVKES